jgi:hypothetical protein
MSPCIDRQFAAVELFGLFRRQMQRPAVDDIER